MPAQELYIDLDKHFYWLLDEDGKRQGAFTTLYCAGHSLIAKRPIPKHWTVYDSRNNVYYGYGNIRPLVQGLLSI